MITLMVYYEAEQSKNYLF